MGLPDKFDKTLRGNTGLRPVWLPGDPVELGDVLVREKGIFRPIRNLADFGVRYRRQKLPPDRTLSFQAQGVSTLLVQGGVSVDISQVNADASAELRIGFEKAQAYFIRTPRLTGIGIDNLFDVGKRVMGLPNWRRGDYYIAWRVYEAADFVFVGSEKKRTSISFGGLGSAVLNLLTLGASAGISRGTASAGLIEILGKGGPVAIAVVKVRGDGRVEFH